MSKLVVLNLRPDRRALRQFGFAALGGFGLLAALAWWETGVFAMGLGSAREWVVYTLCGLAVGCFGFALVFPRANLPFYWVVAVIGYPIGYILSYVIAGFLFIAVLGPVAIVMRVLGRDPMSRGPNSRAQSYWVERRAQRDPETYFRQF